MIRLLVVIILCLYGSIALAFSHTLELPEAELQSRAEAMMPMEKKKFFITTVLSNPIIDLIASTNEIDLTADVRVTAPGNISGNGKASFKGTLRYENDTGSFFFENLNIRALEIDNVPEESLPKIKKMLEFVAKKFLATKPVYKFKDDELKHKLAKAALKEIQVENEILYVELGLF